VNAQVFEGDRKQVGHLQLPQSFSRRVKWIIVIDTLEISCSIHVKSLQNLIPGIERFVPTDDKQHIYQSRTE
jgi:hypothetical protein